MGDSVPQTPWDLSHEGFRMEREHNFGLGDNSLDTRRLINAGIMAFKIFNYGIIATNRTH